MARLKEDQINRELNKLSGWERVENEISKFYEFKDFVQAISFVNAVAIWAEKLDHHPDIDIRWNKVKLSLSTHSEGGLTAKDFTLAEKIDSLLE